MASKSRNIFISIFVVVWIFIFHYESLRGYYLNAYFKRDFPKLKFLFPPAGWIMFFREEDHFETVEVYGIKNGRPQLIDPHLVFKTRPIGYDNIHRGALFSVVSKVMAPQFCGYMHHKFPYFEDFLVTYVAYPSVINEPFNRQQYGLYQCTQLNK